MPGLVLFLLASSVKHVLGIWLFDHVVQQSGSNSLELDRSRRLVAIKDSPFASQLIISLEHRTVQLNKSLGDNRFVLTLSSLNAHHRRQGAASSNPLGWIILSKVLDARHVTGLLAHHQVSSIHTNSVAVLRVKVGWESASTFVTKEVRLGFEGAGVKAVLSSLLQLTHDGKDQQSLGVNLGDLDIAVGISIKQQLAADGSRKPIEQRSLCLFEVGDDVFFDVTFKLICQNLVDLTDQKTHFRDEFNQTFRNQDNSVVLSSISSCLNDVSNVLGDLFESLVSRGNFLTDQTAVDTSLKGTLQRDM